MGRIPRATYRLQLHPEFGFDRAAEIAGYLAALGVSHLYASPYLQAAPGSTHGYDVVDPGKVNEELGGAEGHARLRAALEAHGLGQVLDVVPNHMAITGPENTWWWDVLENGPSSRYASYFDVEWETPEARPANKVLIPILGDHYGRVVESKEIRLERREGTFLVRYYDHLLPVAPRSLDGIMARAGARAGSDDLAFIADSLERLPLPTAVDRESVLRRHRDKEVIRKQLARLLAERPDTAEAVDALVEEVNAYPDAMDAFLERQNYRLAFWRTARSDLGYRRFFDINTLIALRVEDETVFEDTHRLVLGWLADGTLDGVRIDHPDGLRDPGRYLGRLREAAPEAWIVVEKILAPGERLPGEWPVAGTTGYDFLNLVNGLFVDPAGEAPLTRFYTEFTGEAAAYSDLEREKKLQVLEEILGSDLNRLTHLLLRVTEQHRRYRDYTRPEVQDALREALAAFGVYRTYIRAETGEIGEEDAGLVHRSLDAAKARRADLDPDLFDFLRDVLLLVHRGEAESELVMRFQQLTGPVAAKGVEDTAFYVYNRFAALNEVGGDPTRFGPGLDDFHAALAEASETRPWAMLAGSTHDTKRSEDVRARLAVLSEMPGPWTEAVRRWSGRNERHRRDGLPDRNTEYLLYQTLVGAWPLDEARAGAYMLKAAREAKAHTSWGRPDPAYEDALAAFVHAVLEDPEFRADLEAFLPPVIAAGRVNSLAQTLIRLTAPGVPDFYQGTELWDLSLVDPDNRRPVDFELRRRLLDEEPGLGPEAVLARMEEGLPKLRVIRAALAVRREHPGWYGGESAYRRLGVTGAGAERAVCFIRAEASATVVPRLSAGSEGRGDTAVDLPPGGWRNVFTGDEEPGGARRLEELLARFPVSLLVRAE